MIVDHYFDQSILDRIKLLEEKLILLDQDVRNKMDNIAILIDDNMKINVENNTMTMEYMKEMLDVSARRNADETINIISKYNGILVDMIHKQFENQNKILKNIILDMDKKRLDENEIILGNIRDLNEKLDNMNNTSEGTTNMDYSRLLNNAIRNNIPLGFNTTRAIYALNKFTKEKETDNTKKN